MHVLSMSKGLDDDGDQKNSSLFTSLFLIIYFYFLGFDHFCIVTFFRKK